MDSKGYLKTAKCASVGKDSSRSSTPHIASTLSTREVSQHFTCRFFPLVTSKFKKALRENARVNILTGDETADPKHRRHGLDYYRCLLTPYISNLQASHSSIPQDAYLDRIEISKMPAREDHTVCTVGSQDDDDMV